MALKKLLLRVDFSPIATANTLVNYEVFLSSTISLFRAFLVHSELPSRRKPPGTEVREIDSGGFPSQPLAAEPASRWRCAARYGPRVPAGA